MFNLVKWLRGETGTLGSAKVLGVGSTPTGASIIPDIIPKMTQGKVVPPFDINITHCGYCHSRLIWKQTEKGGTEESYAREQELMKLDYKYWPMLAWGPPRLEWSYGCPKYGESIDGSNNKLYTRKFLITTDEPWKYGGEVGWHYYWWEDPMNSIMKELTNAEA